MTTRRGFIGGILAGIAAAVLPKVAAAMPVDEAEVAPDTLRGIPIEFSRPGDAAYIMPMTYGPIGCVEYRLPDYHTIAPGCKVEWDGIGWSPKITGDGSGEVATWITVWADDESIAFTSPFEAPESGEVGTARKDRPDHRPLPGASPLEAPGGATRDGD